MFLGFSSCSLSWYRVVARLGGRQRVLPRKKRAEEEDKEAETRGSAVALGDDKVESGDPDPIDPRAARTVASG